MNTYNIEIETGFHRRTDTVTLLNRDAETAEHALRQVVPPGWVFAVVGPYTASATHPAYTEDNGRGTHIMRAFQVAMETR